MQVLKPATCIDDLVGESVQQRRNFKLERLRRLMTNSNLDRYSGCSGDFVLVVRCLSCGRFEPDSVDECIKIIDEPVVETVELRSPLVSDSGIGADGAKKTRGQRGVDALE